MPKAPADRPHGTGDRNADHLARADEKVHDRRDEERAEDAREVHHEGERDMGMEHP